MDPVREGTEPRSSPLATLIGLAIVAAVVAVVGLWLRPYVDVRQDAFLLNSTDQTIAVYFGDVRHTLLTGESMAVTAPRDPHFEIGIRVGDALRTETVTRTPNVHEVFVVDPAPGSAAYVVLDMTPRFAAPGTPAHQHLRRDGRTFRPKLVERVTARAVTRLTGGSGATFGPLAALPKAVWVSRKYGRTAFKVFRVSEVMTSKALLRAVEAALRDEQRLVTLELSLTSTSTPASR